MAIEKKLVTVHADLAPDRRIHATSGQARNLYAELIRNISTRTKPDGGGLSSIVERFIGEIEKAASVSGESVNITIHKRLAPLQEMVLVLCILAHCEHSLTTNLEDLKVFVKNWISQWLNGMAIFLHP